MQFNRRKSSAFRIVPRGTEYFTSNILLGDCRHTHVSMSPAAFLSAFVDVWAHLMRVLVTTSQPWWWCGASYLILVGLSCVCAHVCLWEKCGSRPTRTSCNQTAIRCTPNSIRLSTCFHSPFPAHPGWKWQRRDETHFSFQTETEEKTHIDKAFFWHTDGEKQTLCF